MPAQFDSPQDAAERLGDPRALSEEEARALLKWGGLLLQFLPRVQMDLALQQITAINRFNDASGRLTKAAIFVGCAQVAVGLIAVAIAVFR